MCFSMNDVVSIIRFLQNEIVRLQQKTLKF